MTKTPRISGAEWAVMKIVWERNPITASEVTAALEDEQGWAANTVRTLLSRLVLKKVLRYSREANRYLYRPAMRREDCANDEVDSLIQRLFDGAAQPLMVHFVKNKKLSPAEIRELRDLLNREDV
jgi:BlaI family penicillinase repressor